MDALDVLACSRLLASEAKLAPSQPQRPSSAADWRTAGRWGWLQSGGRVALVRTLEFLLGACSFVDLAAQRRHAEALVMLGGLGGRGSAG